MYAIRSYYEFPKMTVYDCSPKHPPCPPPPPPCCCCCKDGKDGKDGKDVV